MAATAKRKIETKMAYDLTLARHDSMLCLVPGLFLSLVKGGRKRTPLDITYRYSKTETVEFTGRSILCADDMRLLQGLVAVSGLKGVDLPPEPKKSVAKQLRKALVLQREATDQTAMVVRTTKQQMLTETGLTDSGGNGKGFLDSLKRLASVTVFFDKIETDASGKEVLWSASSNLMSYAFNDGELFVALNPFLTAAIVGDRRHTHIDMAEVRALESDPARLIHQRLCGWINLGQTREIDMDTVCDYIWSNPVGKSAISKRQSKVRKAMDELIGLGWGVAEYQKDGKTQFRITRPKRRPQ